MTECTTKQINKTEVMNGELIYYGSNFYYGQYIALYL